MNNKPWDAIWINANVATFENNGLPFGLINNAAVAIHAGKIVWIGPMATAPLHLVNEVFDAQGKCITPCLIDCHTHLVYAGNRSHEFELRLQGASYEEIARKGGGIRSTVAATRAASEDELFAQSIKRARALFAEGVTTIEIKSGYGLDLETELKMLRVAKRIAATLPVTISATFLGAHALPPEFHGRADEYIDLVCEEMMPRIAQEKLAQNVDVFCETIGFTLAQTQRVFAAAQQHGLGIKCHAEQLSDSGSAALAASYQALSVDHLEFISVEGIDALAKSETVAVLLPGAFYFLREKKLPPIDLFRQRGIPMALATDSNPGTSPITSLLLILNMACTLFRFTPEEALLGVTRHAAKALGLEESHGCLQVGRTADFVVWDVKHPAELAYQIGINSCLKIILAGQIVSNDIESRS